MDLRQELREFILDNLDETQEPIEELSRKLLKRASKKAMQKSGDSFKRGLRSLLHKKRLSGAPAKNFDKALDKWVQSDRFKTASRLR